MIEKDTIKLLRECDAGVKMGVDSIDEVLDKVESKLYSNYILAILCCFVVLVISLISSIYDGCLKILVK